MPKIISQSVKDQAYIDYVEGGMTSVQAGKKNGISANVVLKIVGDKVRPNRNKGKKVVDQSDITSSSERGLTGTTIVVGGRKLIKLPTEQSFNKSKAWESTEDELLRMALKEGMSVKEVSALLGRTITSIYSRKTILVNEGFLKKGDRFKSPRGYLRKKPCKCSTPEAEAKVQQDKLIKKLQLNGDLHKHTVPKEEDINMYGEPLVRFEDYQNDIKLKLEAVEFDHQNEIQECMAGLGKSIDEAIQPMKLEDTITIDKLASLVEKNNVIVTVSITKTGTDIRIERGK